MSLLYLCVLLALSLLTFEPTQAENFQSLKLCLSSFFKPEIEVDLYDVPVPVPIMDTKKKKISGQQTKYNDQSNRIIVDNKLLIISSTQAILAKPIENPTSVFNKFNFLKRKIPEEITNALKKNVGSKLFAFVLPNKEGKNQLFFQVVDKDNKLNKPARIDISNQSTTEKWKAFIKEQRVILDAPQTRQKLGSPLLEITKVRKENFKDEYKSRYDEGSLGIKILRASLFNSFEQPNYTLVTERAPDPARMQIELTRANISRRGLSSCLNLPTNGSQQPDPLKEAARLEIERMDKIIKMIVDLQNQTKDPANLPRVKEPHEFPKAR